MSKLQHLRPDRAHRRILLGSAAVLSLILPHAALAQVKAVAAAQAPVESASAKETALDEVVVTGSSIRGVAPTGSALIAVGRDTIKMNAPATVSELVSSIPQLGNFGANAEQSTSNRFRSPGFDPNIHNLGIYATLTLFNGHRFAPVGGEAVFPDPSILPVIALQRVEVVADGASAVYGSDAVAGVVNFIYRKDVDGLEASATYGANNSKYQKRDFAAIWGKTWESGGVMVAYEYSDNHSPTQGDLGIVLDQRFRGGRDLRTTSCPDPNITVGGKTYGYPSFATTANRCENSLLNSIVPNGKRHSVLATAHQDLGERVKLWTELNYSNYETNRTSAPRSFTVIVPNTNPYFVLPPGVVATSESVTRSSLGLFPNPHGFQTSEVMGLTGGVDIDLGGGWSAGIMTHFSKTHDFNSDPEIDTFVAQRLANNTTLATAFNPFGNAAQNNAAVLALINNGYTQDNNTHQYLRELQIKADGPVFKIPGGEVRAAVGADFRDEEALQRQFSGAPHVDQVFVRNDDVNRAVEGLYGEVHIPLFSAENAIPGFQRLDVSVSGRYDHYQKLGGTFNPKYGVVWEPIDGVALHASYGKAYAAPNLGLLTSIFGVPQPGSNIAGVGTVNVYNMGGGNPNLTPERAKSYSYGVDYQPNYIHGLRFSATYYHVEYSNLVYKPTTNDAFFNPAFADSITRFPTAAQIAQAIKDAPPQSQVPDTIDYIFRSYAINLGTRRFAGVDLDASYQMETAFGRFSFAANANRQLTFDQQVVAGTPFTSRLGTTDAVKWKARLNATWNMEPFTVAVFMNYTGSFKNTAITPVQTVDAWTTFDLVGTYDLPHVMSGAQIQLRAANVFDKKPPFYDGTGGYYAPLASPFGRTLEATIRMKFW
jgi:iron complex outermembrane receptor protein